MLVEEVAHVLYTLSLIAVMIYGIFITLKYRPANHTSLSQAMGSSRGIYLSSAIILSMLAVALYYGLTLWYVPYHSLPGWSLYIPIAVLVLIIRLAWLPTDGKIDSRSHKIHFTIGGVLGICLMILVVATINYSNQLSSFNYWISLASVVYCTMCYFFYFFMKQTRQWFLLLELVAIGSILFTLLLLAF